MTHGSEGGNGMTLKSCPSHHHVCYATTAEVIQIFLCIALAGFQPALWHVTSLAAERKPGENMPQLSFYSLGKKPPETLAREANEDRGSSGVQVSWSISIGRVYFLAIRRRLHNGIQLFVL